MAGKRESAKELIEALASDDTVVWVLAIDEAPAVLREWKGDDE